MKLRVQSVDDHQQHDIILILKLNSPNFGDWIKNTKKYKKITFYTISLAAFNFHRSTSSSSTARIKRPFHTIYTSIFFFRLWYPSITTDLRTRYTTIPPLIRPIHCWIGLIINAVKSDASSQLQNPHFDNRHFWITITALPSSFRLIVVNSSLRRLCGFHFLQLTNRSIALLIVNNITTTIRILPPRTISVHRTQNHMHACIHVRPFNCAPSWLKQTDKHKHTTTSGGSSPFILVHSCWDSDLTRCACPNVFFFPTTTYIFIITQLLFLCFTFSIVNSNNDMLPCYSFLRGEWKASLWSPWRPPKQWKQKTREKGNGKEEIGKQSRHITEHATAYVWNFAPFVDLSSPFRWCALDGWNFWWASPLHMPISIDVYHVAVFTFVASVHLSSPLSSNACNLARPILIRWWAPRHCKWLVWQQECGRPSLPQAQARPLAHALPLALCHNKSRGTNALSSICY